MPDLRFPMDGVRRLAAATRAATRREPTTSQQGLAPDRIPAGFWLVKDQGVALVSNDAGQAHESVYAVGLGPRTDPALVQAFVGPTDFRTFVPLHWADEALRTLGATHLVIHLTGSRITLRPPTTG